MFDFEPVGMIDVKGLGPTETYLLRGLLENPITAQNAFDSRLSNGTA